MTNSLEDQQIIFLKQKLELAEAKIKQLELERQDWERAAREAAGIVTEMCQQQINEVTTRLRRIYEWEHVDTDEQPQS